jgi:hypothetical protein
MGFFPELAARGSRKADPPKKRSRRSKPEQQSPGLVVEEQLDFIEGDEPGRPELPVDQLSLASIAFEKVGTQR